MSGSRSALFATNRRNAMLGKTKWFSFDVQDNGMTLTNQSSLHRGLGAGGPLLADGGASTAAFGLGVDGYQPTQQQLNSRRGSFLFRSESEDCGDTRTLTGSGSSSRLTSLIAGQLHETHLEEQIVTPFAQILHRLQTARNNYVQLTNVSGTSKRHANNHERDVNGTCSMAPPLKMSDDKTRELAVDILNDIDWCLDHLETIHTHRSVSDMASTKFKRLLNKELSQLAVSSKSGSQVSEYITNTFLDKDEEVMDAEAADASQVVGNGPGGPRGVDRQCRTTSMMSRISGVRRLTSNASGTGGSSHDGYVTLPTYGVTNVADSLLAEPMSTLDQWGVDIFYIDSLTNSRSLVAVTYTILKERNLISKLHLSARTLLTYLSHVEDHYRNVPYHNHLHAADVTQSIHALLSLPALQNVFTDLELLAVIFAGAIHDVDHPGVTNQYLINTSSELALMYNDESVLENHHLAVAFKLLQEEQCDFLKPLVAKSRQRIRRMAIDLVLATDMSKHMSLLAELKTMVETRKVTGSGVLLLDNYTDRMQVLQNMIHCADLSNPTKPLYLYRQWTDRIMQEFFEQGDIERELGLDISPMCDRHTATVEKSQVGFIDFIVQPLWETWADLVHPYCSELLDVLEDNRDWYSSRIATSPTSSSSSSASERRGLTSPTTPAEDDDDAGEAATATVVVCGDPDDPVATTADVGGEPPDPPVDDRVEFIAARHPDGVRSTSRVLLPPNPVVVDATTPLVGLCPHPDVTSPVDERSMGYDDVEMTS